MNSSLISICIPTYNGQKFLRECIDSAIIQTYKNIEIIIVDDASTDNTYEIAMQYAAKDIRIKLFQNEKNIGLVPNWNRCVEHSKGEWIKFLFQDDYFVDTCLEIMMTNLSEKDKIIACKRTFIFDKLIENGKKQYYTHGIVTFEKLGITSQTPVFIEPKQIAVTTVKNICMNFIGEPTVIMFKKNVTAAIGIFNPDLGQICDLEYFLRIATKYGVKYISEPLAYFRIHSESTSSVNVTTRSFVMKHLETTITTHQLLYSDVFSDFRNALSIFKKIKLRIYFNVHVYEAMVSALGTNKENIAKFEEICNKYPEVEKHKNGSGLIRSIFFMVRLRRKGLSTV